MNNKCYFANSETGCRILKKTDCDIKCSFFLTPQQYAEGCQRANEKLLEKSEEEQSRISEKYYNCRFPWKQFMKEVKGNESRNKIHV